MASETELLAKKLSPAQRNLLVSARMSGDDWCVYYGNSRSTMDALIRRGLVEYRTGLANCLTPAGIVARAATMGGSDD